MWSAPTGNPYPGRTFWFHAEGVAASEVAAEISAAFGVSVLVHTGSAGLPVTGHVAGATVKEAVESLGFLLGLPSRQDASGGFWYVGGGRETELESFPTYGLPAAVLGGAFKERGTLLGDRLLVDAEAPRLAQVRKILDTLADRRVLRLELVVLDSAKRDWEYVNKWLDQFRVAGGYMARSAVATGTGGAGEAAKGLSWVRGQGVTYDVDVNAVLGLVDTERRGKVRLRQVAQVLSGSKTRFESGQVVEDKIYTREPYTGEDLVSSIERRTVGFTCDLAATAATNGWFLTLDLQDSGFVGGQEVRTQITADHLLRVGGALVELLRYERDTTEGYKQAVTGFAKLPVVGPLFRKSDTQRNRRVVVVFARGVWEGGAQ